MKKAATILAWTVAAVCCVVAAYFCHFYYVRYKTIVTDLEGRINGFDMRLATLEGHKSRQLTPVRVWAVLSTSDKPPDKNIQFYLPSAKLPDGYFEAINAKGGPLVRPELRLPAGATSNCVFNIQVESQFGLSLMPGYRMAHHFRNWQPSTNFAFILHSRPTYSDSSLGPKLALPFN